MSFFLSWMFVYDLKRCLFVLRWPYVLTSPWVLRSFTRYRNLTITGVARIKAKWCTWASLESACHTNEFDNYSCSFNWGMTMHLSLAGVWLPPSSWHVCRLSVAEGEGARHRGVHGDESCRPADPGRSSPARQGVQPQALVQAGPHDLWPERPYTVG